MKTQTKGLAAEREQAAALRGRHDERYAREAQERAEVERSRQAAFGRHDERLAEVERIADLLRADRDRQRAKVRRLEQERKVASTRLVASVDAAREQLGVIASSASEELKEWLRRLPRAAVPTPPPPAAVALYLLRTDSKFEEWLLAELEQMASEDGPLDPDPRGRDEIRAELERIGSDLASASAELERREQITREAGHAIRAAEANASGAVTAFLSKHGEQG